MTEADLLAYTGAIGGVVGTFSGVAGAVIAYLSYKKTEQLKVLDLRIELAKLVVGMFEDYDDMCALMERAEKSRLAVASATGGRDSGALERWMRQFKADEESIKSLYESLEELNANHSIASPKELEDALVTAHVIQTTGNRIRQTYEQSLEEDEKQREQLRASAKDRHAPRKQGE